MPRFFCSTQEKEVIIKHTARVDDSAVQAAPRGGACLKNRLGICPEFANCPLTVSYTHLRAHETDS